MKGVHVNQNTISALVQASKSAFNYTIFQAKLSKKQIFKKNIILGGYRYVPCRYLKKLFFHL